MPFKFDPEEAGEAKGFDLLPEDLYDVRIDDMQVRETTTGENKGAQNFAVTAVLTSGDFKGRKQWDNFSFLPQARWRLNPFLEATLGDAAAEFELFHVIGKPATILVGIRQKMTQNAETGKWDVPAFDNQGNPILVNYIKEWLPPRPEGSSPFKGFS
jgi:hypothetical protein